MDTDSIIWDKLRKGDQQSLQLIYSNHIEAMLQYGKRFIANEQQLEDAIHDLFVQLWTRREKLGPTDSIIKYLLVSLKRSLFKLSKANLKIVGSDKLEAEQFEGELSIETLLIEGEDAAEKGLQLKQAFETLSAKQKEAIYLRYYQNLGYEAIAEVMEINYQSVRNLVSKGVIRMREAMLAIIILCLIIMEMRL